VVDSGEVTSERIVPTAALVATVCTVAPCGAGPGFARAPWRTEPPFCRSHWRQSADTRWGRWS